MKSESSTGKSPALSLSARRARLTIATNLLMGRTLRSIAYEILKRLNDLVGWLLSPVRHRRLVRFERRYFTVRRWHAVAVTAMTAAIFRFLIREWKEHTSGRSAQRRHLVSIMENAQSYEEWVTAARSLEVLQGPKRDVLDQLYDRQLIQQRLAYLQSVRQAKGQDAAELAFALRSDLLRNLGNVASPAVHRATLSVPQPIRDYIDEVRTQIRMVSTSPSLSLEERLAFLRETRHAFGRTALVLSGGGSFGSFHLGVVKSLLEASLLPRVLSGSSAGAIVAALICTRTDDELAELFAALPERLQGIDFYASNSAAQIFKHLVLKGTLQDHSVLQERLQRLLGDVTFQEAYARSGRILNVSVTAADTREPPRLLNYLSTPNVIVWSAVACSSAFPFLFVPQSLLARDSRGRVVPFANQGVGEMQRRWRDGSLEEDLPMRGLSEMFNVNYFLVSQCNPYLLPIIAAKRAVPGTIGALAEQEFKHRCKQLMEVLPRSLGASRLLKLLSQPWEGDVTMVLPASRLSSLKAVINLSKEDLLLALSEGQRATWAKLSTIAANCDVEVTLDECLKRVTSMVWRARRSTEEYARDPTKMAVQRPIRRGIPSWLHLQALGVPQSNSLEALGLAAVEEAEVDEAEGEDGMSDQLKDKRLTAGLAPLECDSEQVWKELFNVVPATTSDALDFIAP